MAQPSPADTLSDALSLTALKRLGRRAIFFFILSVPVVGYVVVEASDEMPDIWLFLGFTLAFTTVLMGITLTLQFIAWLLSWLSG